MPAKKKQKKDEWDEFMDHVTVIDPLGVDWSLFKHFKVTHPPTPKKKRAPRKKKQVPNKEPAISPVVVDLVVQASVRDHALGLIQRPMVAEEVPERAAHDVPLYDEMVKHLGEEEHDAHLFNMLMELADMI